MNEFDLKARLWDQNPMHWDRSRAIVNELSKILPFRKDMTALEYGAGTGITSFILKDYLKEIVMLDTSLEMIRIMNEKIKLSGTRNLKTKFFNLERENWTGTTFDLLIAQMILHHVADVDNIIRKFHSMLNPGGCLAVADLYPEDGSFHGEEFTGHKGFDTKKLSTVFIRSGFKDISESKCFEITKKDSEGTLKQYGVFLMTGKAINQITK